MVVEQINLKVQDSTLSGSIGWKATDISWSRQFPYNQSVANSKILDRGGKSRRCIEERSSLCIFTPPIKVFCCHNFSAGFSLCVFSQVI